MTFFEMRRLRGLDRRMRLGLVVGLACLGLAILGAIPRIPLGAGYHDFADKRDLLGIPNCLDVLSNIPFIVSGCWGLSWLFLGRTDSHFALRLEKLPYIIFFLGVTLTGIGSYWYHLNPGNARLPWDLLPMTFSFMSMVTAVVIERINAKVGFSIFIPLLLLGAASVIYWWQTEAAGHGDYRFYLFVQFFSPVLLALIIALFPPRYTGMGYLIGAFVLFTAAKLMELYDWKIYSALGFVSGHALKHATAGVACYWILRMLQHRQIIGQESEARTTSSSDSTFRGEHQTI